MVRSSAMAQVACGLAGQCALKRAMNRTTTNLRIRVKNGAVGNRTCRF